MAADTDHDRKSDLPAVAGGKPAKTGPYGHLPKYDVEEELQQLKEALEQGSLFYAHGKKVNELESEFAGMHGMKFAVACSSGTASIHAAMIAAGISPEEEVITAPITDMGSLIPILYQGAIPVFADLDPHTYTLSPAAVEDAITPKTRAVLAVHLWGNACHMNELCAICDRHGLTLIEDCAQAWGCLYDGKPVGSLGDIGCFSLNEFKHISCGDGGLCATNDEALAHRLRLATDKCYDRTDPTNRDPRFLATNSRMTELQGAASLPQLKKLDDLIERRRNWCGKFQEKMSSIQGISLPQPTPKCNPSWWFYMFRVQPEILGADSETFAAALNEEGIPVSARYTRRCVYEYPVFTDHSAFARGTHPYAAREYARGLCPTAEAILDTAVMFGINEGYTELDLEETVHGIRRTADWFRSKNRI